jgi:hypothetical protein
MEIEEGNNNKNNYNKKYLDIEFAIGLFPQFL